jgi:hypothetical protein
MAKNGYPQATYDFYKSNGSDTVVFNREPSLTRQEFAEECDINTLMKRYEGHGQTINYLLAQPAQGGMYLDFAELPQDLMGYMQFMDKAKVAFMTLPAIVRKEFDNDPIMFCDFASDPENLEQMRAWDLAPKAKIPEVAAAATAAPTSSQAPAAAAEAVKTPGST